VLETDNTENTGHWLGLVLG